MRTEFIKCNDFIRRYLRSNNNVPLFVWFDSIPVLLFILHGELDMQKDVPLDRRSSRTRLNWLIQGVCTYLSYQVFIDAWYWKNGGHVSGVTCFVRIIIITMICDQGSLSRRQSSYIPVTSRFVLPREETCLNRLAWRTPSFTHSPYLLYCLSLVRYT